MNQLLEQVLVTGGTWHDLTQNFRNLTHFTYPTWKSIHPPLPGWGSSWISFDSAAERLHGIYRFLTE